MDRAVPGGVLAKIVQPFHPKAKTGPPPFDIDTMLRIHYPMSNGCEVRAGVASSSLRRASRSVAQIFFSILI